MRDKDDQSFSHISRARCPFPPSAFQQTTVRGRSEHTSCSISAHVPKHSLTSPPLNSALFITDPPPVQTAVRRTGRWRHGGSTTANTGVVPAEPRRLWRPVVRWHRWSLAPDLYLWPAPSLLTLSQLSAEYFSLHYIKQAVLYSPEYFLNSYF